jgi:ASCH domain
MLTLSIQQPWAWAICHLGKDVENRSWPTKFRGQFLVHAGKRVDRDGYDYLYDQWRVEAPDEKIIGCGGIVGVAEIIDCVSVSSSPWFFGPYGFVLREQRPLAFVPLRGQLGFFDTVYNGALKAEESSATIA